MLYSVLAAAQSPSEVASQAGQAMQAQDFPKAERLYLELTRLAPDVPEVYSNLGLARYYQKKFQTGQQAFEAALRLNPDLFVPNFFLGKILSETGRFAPALPLAGRAVKAQPEDKAARRLLASVLLGLKRENQAISQYQKLIEQDPRDIESLYDLALVYLDRGTSAFDQLSKYKETGFAQLVAAEYDAQREGFQAAATDEYRRAIAASPALPGLRVALGNLLVNSEKWQPAGKLFQEELTVDPFSYEAKFGLARVSLHEGDCETAIHDLNDAVGIRPEFFDPLPNLVAGLSPAELRTSCSASLKAVISKESFGAMLLLWSLAEAEAQTGQGALWRTQAERTRDEVIQNFRTRARSASVKLQTRSERRKLGVKYLQEKRYEEGLAVLSPLLAENSEDPQFDLLVSRSLFSLERFSDVLNFLDHIHVDNPETFYLRGASGKRLALQLMNKIVEIDPQSARSHQLFASTYMAQQMYPEAAREYEIALKIEPNDPELYFALGNAYFKGQKFQDAERAYARALELNPLHAEAHGMRGAALVQLGRPQEAVPEVRQALQLNPGLVSAHAILGKALAETGQVAEAVQQLELAQTTDTDGSLHYQLAGLYRRLGDPEKAKQALLASEKIRRQRQQAMEESVVLPAPDQTEVK
jgi:tetratricopeptide (TPR) repeat protein